MDSLIRRFTELNRELVIASLAECKSISDAAAKANVSRTTIYELLKDPAFRLQYLEFRQHAITEASCILTGRLTEAVEAIYSVLDNPTQPGARTRLAAARLALAQAYRFQEVEMLSGQLAVAEKS